MGISHIRANRTVTLRLSSGGLGDRTVEATISTPQLARDGDVWVPSGCQAANYRKNPVVLWQHDPGKPIGTASVAVSPSAVTAVITFAPEGVSRHADEVCGLVKSGVLSGISCGINPIEQEPLDASRRFGPRKITNWELYEISVVSIPADTGAMVTARAYAQNSDDLSFAARQARLNEFRSVGALTCPPRGAPASAAHHVAEMTAALAQTACRISASSYGMPNGRGDYERRQQELRDLRRD